MAKILTVSEVIVELQRMVKEDNYDDLPVTLKILEGEEGAKYILEVIIHDCATYPYLVKDIINRLIRKD